MTIFLPVASSEPLAYHRDRAEAKLTAAAEEYYRVQMSTVARIVTAALPEAASIDLVRHRFDGHGEMWLLAVHAADATPLWGDELDDDPLAEFHFANGESWRQAAEVIAETASSALAGEDAEAAADRRSDWLRLRLAGPVEAYRVAMPDRATVEHYTTTLPGPHEPRVKVVVDRGTDDGTDVHAFVDGVAVLGEVTVVDPGRGWQLSEWRDQAAEEVAAASPEAAEVITRLYRAAESSPFIHDDTAT